MMEMEISHEKKERNGCDTPGKRRASEIPLSLKKLVLQTNGTLTKIDKNLLVFKYFYFLFYSSVGTTFPFLSGYFRQIGLSPSQIGALSGIRPAVQLFFSPLWGIIGDRYISKKMLIQFSLFVWLVVTISLAFLEPTGQICQLISVNNTDTKVINYTKMKTGFFRRRRSIVEINEMPLLPDLQSTVKPMDISEVEPGSTSDTSTDEQDEHTSGSGLIGSGEKDLDIFALLDPLKHETIEITAQEIKPEEHGLKVTTRNVLRDSPARLHEIFVLALAMMAIVELFSCPLLVLLDAVLLSKQHEEKFSYGQQRLFGSLGYMVFFFIVGVLLEKSMRPACGELYFDYIICFCFFCFVTIVTLVVIVRFDFPYTKPAARPCHRLKSIFYNRHHGTLLAAVCFMGFSHSLLGSYYHSFLIVSEVKYGSVLAINFFRFTGEPIAFFMSSMILNRAGTINVLFGIPVVTAFNLFASSFVSSPWQIVPLGFIDGFTYGISWVACATYLVNSAPFDCTATVQGFLQSAYWGIGNGLSILIGSNLTSLIGPGAALRLFTALALITAVIFTIGLRELHFPERNYYTTLMSRLAGLCGGAKCEVVPPGRYIDSRTEVTSPMIGDAEKIGKTVVFGLK